MDISSNQVNAFDDLIDEESPEPKNKLSKEK
jgi:hypothetical protein